MTSMSAAQYQATLGKPQKKAKYGNRKVTIDGITFDSVTEGRFYSELKLREKAGEVYEVQMQTPYALTVNGQLVCTYKPDFCFYDAIAKRQRVVDVKGVQTKDFIIKKKLMRAVHGIEVEIVK
jgi:uncharacterized membrane protein